MQTFVIVYISRFRHFCLFRTSPLQPQLIHIPLPMWGVPLSFCYVRRYMQYMIPAIHLVITSCICKILTSNATMPLIHYHYAFYSVVILNTCVTQWNYISAVFMAFKSFCLHALNSEPYNNWTIFLNVLEIILRFFQISFP